MAEQKLQKGWSQLHALLSILSGKIAGNCLCLALAGLIYNLFDATIFKSLINRELYAFFIIRSMQSLDEIIIYDAKEHVKV